MQSIERCYFEWLWTTSNLDFKFTPLFDAEYFRNGTRYIHSYSEILIGSYTCAIQGCHFEWPRVSWMTDLVKCSCLWTTHLLIFQQPEEIIDAESRLASLRKERSEVQAHVGHYRESKEKLQQQIK